ncbi:MAG: hypothetical protein JOZ46_05180, partial [Candidatus Dormibacteraeota bacterium]|nr:hypothetical protein [Candidatus Dormibacteraeota bacterium]
MPTAQAPARAPLRELDLAATRIKGCCNAVAAPLPDEVAQQLALLHRAIGDPTRVQMLHILKAAD